MTEIEQTKTLKKDEVEQLCGFRLADGFYGVPVLGVQEVIKAQKVTPIPLAPKCIKGLINLRGQIVTAVSLRILFGIAEEGNLDHMNIIVRSGDSLYALEVDEILDVMDLELKNFEERPDTLREGLKKFIIGAYKLNKKLLIKIDLQKILKLEE